ncbi:unnamed protein product [Calypogeia fissa]
MDGKILQSIRWPSSWPGFGSGFHFHLHVHRRDFDKLQRAFLTSAIAICIMLVVLGYKLMSRKKGRKPQLPPGPRPWPIFGSLGVLRRLPHQDLAKLAEKYGPIFHLRLGSRDVIVVSSPKLAEEILRTKDHIFASRASDLQGVIISNDRQTIAASEYGPYWRHARKVFTLELLTNRRLQHFQSLRKEEVMTLLQSFLEECKTGIAVRADLKFKQLTMNNITQMLFNKAFLGPNSTVRNVNDTTSYIEVITELFRLYGVFNLGDYIPLLQNFDLQGYKKQMREVQRQNDIFLDSMIDEHRQRLASQTSEQLRDSGEMDFVDVLLTRPSGKDEKPLTDQQIKSILLDAIVAGIETSSVAMEWTMTRLLKHPEVLKKVQDELDAVVGRTRLVEEADIPNLKYFRAVVKETFRLHPVSAMMIPHYSMEATEVAGYHIPKNTRVFINQWALGRDSATWERPLEFEPERFLTSGIDYSNGQGFELVTFSSGRRSCPGRNLGLLVVEYTLAVLLHACNWSLPPGVSPEDVDLGESPGLTVPKAIHLEVVASPRLPLEIIDGNKKDKHLYPQL